MPITQLRTALFIVWIVLSTTILVVLITPFVISPETIYAIAPQCEWKARYGKECPLCGMTASFIYISKGEFTRARQSNGFSLFLYMAFAANTLTTMLTLGRKATGLFPEQKPVAIFDQ